MSPPPDTPPRAGPDAAGSGRDAHTSGFRCCQPGGHVLGLRHRKLWGRSDVVNEMVNVGGRPAVGPAFQVRFPEELLARVDRAAEGEGLTRAGWLRAAAQDRVQVPREELSGFVLWLLTEQMVAPSEVARVIEKPWSYQDWLRCYRD